MPNYPSSRIDRWFFRRRHKPTAPFTSFLDMYYFSCGCLFEGKTSSSDLRRYFIILGGFSCSSREDSELDLAHYWWNLASTVTAVRIERRLHPMDKVY